MAKNILVVGNWKQHPPTLEKAKKIFMEIRSGVKRTHEGVTIMIAPPTPFLSELNRLSPSGRIGLVAQDVSLFEAGAHTGEVALSMVASVGASEVIVGHSERRAGGEDDVLVHQKLLQVTRRHKAILCVGETTREKDAEYFSVVEKQLHAALSGLTKAQIKRIAIAYEPVWAIGTGKNATVEMIEEMRLFIRKVLTDLYDRTTAESVLVLYGGSVKANNAEDILRFGGVDGFLVGGASLKATEFTNIIATAHAYKKDRTT